MTGVGPAFLKHHEGGEDAICTDEHDSCGRYVEFWIISLAKFPKIRQIMLDKFYDILSTNRTHVIVVGDLNYSERIT